MITPLEQDRVGGSTHTQCDDRELQTPGAQGGQCEQQPHRDSAADTHDQRRGQRPVPDRDNAAGDERGNAGRNELAQADLAGEPDQDHQRHHEQCPERIGADGSHPVAR